MSNKPRVAVFKLTSCDGCQLQLLDAEEALLVLASEIDIVYFREATSREEPGPFDLSIIEGSVSEPWQLDEVKKIRSASSLVVAIGACATTGGIQALRNLADIDAFVSSVYPSPEYIHSLRQSTPVTDHMEVDLELSGCPVDRGQLLGAVASLLRGAMPHVSRAPVCVECKRRGYACVVVTRGEACLGPITATGCGALCPAFGRGCYGCFGPSDGLNTAAMRTLLQMQGQSEESIASKLRFINCWAPELREEATSTSRSAAHASHS